MKLICNYIRWKLKLLSVIFIYILYNFFFLKRDIFNDLLLNYIELNNTSTSCGNCLQCKRECCLLFLMSWRSFSILFFLCCYEYPWAISNNINFNNTQKIPMVKIFYVKYRNYVRKFYWITWWNKLLMYTEWKTDILSSGILWNTKGMEYIK